MFRRRLSTDGNGSGVIESVVVDANRLPEPAVDKPLLELRSWVVHHVRKHICRVRRFGVLSNARTLPLDLNSHRADRRFDQHSLTFLERRNRRNRISDERVGAATPLSKLALGESKDGGGTYIT